MTPLYTACLEGHIPVVEHLIAAKADVNHQIKVHPVGGIHAHCTRLEKHVQFLRMHLNTLFSLLR